MTLGSFGMILLLSREGFEAENLDDFKGLNQRDRWYAFLMLLIMFSLAGLPVMIGFWAKLAVLQAAFEAGYTGLVVAAVLFSLIGAYYYLRVVKLMYFDEPVDQSPIVTSADQRAGDHGQRPGGAGAGHRCRAGCWRCASTRSRRRSEATAGILARDVLAPSGPHRSRSAQCPPTTPRRCSPRAPATKASS